MGLNKTNPVEVGKNIREARERKSKRDGKDIQQKDLAKMLGISDAIMNYWEAGTRPIKSSDYVIAMADYLDTTCDFILRGIDATNVALSREYGGLSNKTLEAIKSLHVKPSTALGRDNIKRVSRINTVNALFENIEIFDLIHSFLTLDMKMFVKDFGKCKVVIEPNEPKSNDEKQIDTDLTLEDVSLGLFFKIQQALIALRDKYNNNNEDERPKAKPKAKRTKAKE